MIVEKKDGSKERRLVTGVIVDSTVCGAVAQRWEAPGFFRSRAANLIAGWCVRYYKKYGKAPGRHVEALFDVWADKGHNDAEVVTAIEQLLRSLSGDHARLKKQSQSAFLIDLAGEYFTQTKMQGILEQVTTLVQQGEVVKADALLKSYNKVELGAGATVDVFEDKEAWKRAFDHRVEPLVTYPGAAGVFFADVLSRDAFVAFEGQTGGGKSFWLQDVCHRAVLQGRRVALFQCGDMSEGQMIHRLAARIARRPMDKCVGEDAVKVPTRMASPRGGGFVKVHHRRREWKDKLSMKAAWAKVRALRKRLGAAGPVLKMETHPARGVSVYGIKSRVEQWITTGWVPDVIVIDYADILATPSGSADEDRGEINTTWLIMRAMSTQYHNLVVTASQVNRAAYDTTVIELKHTSEERRKMDHVTASVGITRTKEEAENGVSRLMFVKPPRHRRVNITRSLFTAGALELANPCILSQL